MSADLKAELDEAIGFWQDAHLPAIQTERGRAMLARLAADMRLLLERKQQEEQQKQEQSGEGDEDATQDRLTAEEVERQIKQIMGIANGSAVQWNPPEPSSLPPQIRDWAYDDDPWDDDWRSRKEKEKALRRVEPWIE